MPCSTKDSHWARQLALALSHSATQLGLAKQEKHLTPAPKSIIQKKDVQRMTEWRVLQEQKADRHWARQLALALSHSASQLGLTGQEKHLIPLALSPLPSLHCRKRAYRLKKKNAAALLAPQNPPPGSERRILKRRKHAKLVQEIRRVTALNKIELKEKSTQKGEEERIAKLPWYTEVWENVLQGDEIKSNGSGGSSSGVYHCKATMDGVVVEVALKVMKIHKLCEKTKRPAEPKKRHQRTAEPEELLQRPAEPEERWKNLIQNVGEVLREVNMALLLARKLKAPAEKVLRMARTKEHPDGIVVALGRIAALTRWQTNQGVIDCRQSRKYSSERWKNGVMPLACAMSLFQTLQEMHSLHVAHRDLKAANVRVNDNGAVTLIDLGGSVDGLNPAFGEGLCYYRPRPAKDGTGTTFPGKVEDSPWTHPPGFYVDQFAPPVAILPTTAPPVRSQGHGSARAQSAVTAAQLLPDVIARTARWTKIADMIKDNSLSVVGINGTSCGRAPESVQVSYGMREVYRKDGPKRKELLQSTADRVYTQSSECYAAGVIVLEWVTGVNACDLAHRHKIYLAKNKKLAAPGPTARKGCDKYHADNNLHAWIETHITGQEDNATIVGTLRAFRGLEGRTAPYSDRTLKVHRGLEGWQGGTSGRAWNALAAVLKGLFAPQRDRWTMAQAVEKLRAVHQDHGLAGSRPRT
jgi:hypothetical protein